MMCSVLGAQREVVHHGQLGDIDAAVNDQFSQRIRAVVGDIRAGQAAILDEM